MISFLRWILGWCEFSIEGNTGAFFYTAKKEIWKISKKDGVLIARCLTKDYRYVCELAELKSCAINKYREGGFISILKKYRYRVGIILGIFIFAFLMGISNFFVWEVEVNGNVQLSDEQIFRVCDKFGLHSGSIVFNIDVSQIEFELKREFPQIAWISINRVASKYFIEVSETKNKPDIVEQSTPCNIVAAFDGEILSVEPYGGLTLVKAGDVVTKNQLLVSGIHEIENSNEIIYSHANAKIIARVERNNEVKRSRCIVRSQKTGEKQNKKTLLIFCFKIPITFEKIDEHAVKDSEYVEPIELFGIRLPIFVQNDIYDVYDEVKVENDIEQLKRMLMNDQKKWEIKELMGGKIICRDYVYEEKDNDVILKSKLVVEQQIGEKRTIDIK